MSTELNQPVTIIYHGNCPDGFASALAAHLFFHPKNDVTQPGNITFFAGNHGNPPPDCLGREVYILDFSYPREQMKQLCQQAAKVTIIDHHISACRELDQLEREYDNLVMHFDMNQSAAVLSWKFFHHTPVPRLFAHIQDNDLWKFELENTKTIIMAVMSYPMEFNLWNSWLNNDSGLDILHSEGVILQRQSNKQIQHYRKKARMGKIAGYTIPIVNAPASIGSELLHQLSDGHPFAAAYEDKPDRRAWQLRSGGKHAIDVSEIARMFGGGGHKNASGFRTDTFDIELSAD